LTADRSLVLEFQGEWQRFCEAGGLGSDELYRLGRFAAQAADRRVGAHRIVAYVLRSVLFDLAERAQGDLTLHPKQAGSALAALDAPLTAAISSLLKPLDANRAMTIIGQLLDARQASLDHLG
jgi:hypothetical protein